MTRRIIAQRVRTGEFLAWDVPLTDGGAAVELSGPGGIRGKITPETALLLGDDGLPIFREWSTALYSEDANGNITAGGIVTRITEDEEGKLDIEAPGFTTYPHGIPFVDTKRFLEDDDALDVFRHLWNYVQSFEDGDLGVTVDPLKSGKTLETREKITSPGGKGDPSFETIKVTPYRIPEWEYRDCGEEMDAMLEVAHADYIERHAWNADHTAITHHVELGVPRLGSKRDKLRFVEGENIIVAVPLQVDGDEFAQNIYVVGRGEGRKMKRYHYLTRDDRLRRCRVFTDKHAGEEKVGRLARREFHRYNDTRGFEAIVIRDHPNARIANINPGDDILVEATLEWHGRVRLWNRVISVEHSLDDDTAALRLARSDLFR